MSTFYRRGKNCYNNIILNYTDTFESFYFIFLSIIRERRREAYDKGLINPRVIYNLTYFGN